MSELTALRARVAAEADRELPDALRPLVTLARERFGAGVVAVLFYGSCRRSARVEGMADLYVLLDDYGTLPFADACLARLLPPNVYHLQSASGVRAKCTVITLDDFERGTARAWFHSYLWGRFAQPVSLAYSRDLAAREAVVSALSCAVVTFLRETLPLVASPASPATIWSTGLRASYATELRSEDAARAEEIYRVNAAHFEDLLEHAAPAIDGLDVHGDHYTIAIGTRAARAGQRRWRARRISGKWLSLARVLKSGYTFDGGLDYLIWKLERHSGRRIEVPERVRRRPWLHLWGFFWRLHRQGVFR